ncbi:MAG: response regulator [Prevotella sp.]|nr:response regulator [Prevotella sp.]
MKKAFWAICIITSVLIGCNETNGNHGSIDTSHAEAIADSVRDSEQLQKWLHHYDSLGDERSALLIRQKYGKVIRDKSEFEAAIRQHDTCIAMATKQKDTLQLIIALNNQGTNFRRLGDLQEASNNHYSALELCDKTTHDTSYVARKNRVRTYNGLGNVLLSLNNDSVAESLFRRALAGETELNSATGQAINLANIGAIKEGRGELDSARVYYNMSMEKNKETNNPIGISLCYQNLGQLEFSAGNMTGAMENYRKGFEIGKKTSDVWHWLKPCEAMADIFLEENKIDSARKYINMSLEAALKIKAKSRLAKAYTQNAKLQEKTGQHAKALESIKKAQAYKDSIASEKSQTHIQNLRVKYEVDKRKEEVSRAKTETDYEKTLRKTIMWASITVLILIVIVVLSQLRIIKERKKTLAMLKKVNKERQEFYRGITHQLRTPLTVVNGMTGQLRKFIPADNEVAQREFEAVERKSNELVNLVNEMILYNKGIVKEIEVSEVGNGVRSEEFGVRNEEFGVRSEELGVRSADNSNASNLSARQLVNSSTETSNLSTRKLVNSSTEITNSSTETNNYILVAEDDQDVAFLITEMLKEEGYEYVWAQDGQEALEIMDKQMPNLLITDIMMPRMDGIELIKKIREEDDKRHLPIIVVSARTEDADRLIGLEAGAEVYLGKPFNSEELMLRVRKLLEQREMLRIKYSREIAEADRIEAEEQSQNINGNDREFIEKVDEFIHENIINSELDANALAETMHMSPTTLNRRIKSITGTNTTIYIRLKRLGRAKQLLQNTQMSMGEIQAVCGFESPSYFSRAFKAEYGISPSDFRKKRGEFLRRIF